MRLFNQQERVIATAIGALNSTNPFIPARIELEKRILGSGYVEQGMVWNINPAKRDSHQNTRKIGIIAEALVYSTHRMLGESRAKPGKAELEVYEELVTYYLFEKYRQPMCDIIYGNNKPGIFNCYSDFKADLLKLRSSPQHHQPSAMEAQRMFETFHQIHRAFYYIFDFIIGSSISSGNLRAAIWQSIFTHDIYRYKRALYNKMQNITTLINGPSGTGKELVAKAIALSQYIPFNCAAKCFSDDYKHLFHPLHLSAMPYTLIESELFGHSKGAFTGALQNRIGWMELCSAHGTVFLDEIGEISEAIQVKLLRLLQNRTFQRLGETDVRDFKGKILAATNRLLPEMIEQGSFRSDLYYRLCSDIIETPTLREQLSGSPDELENLVRYIAVNIIGEDEAGSLADETVSWIRSNLGDEYSWAGNFRELEQCVRNILIRGAYLPPRAASRQDDGLVNKIDACTLTADELLKFYCGKVYAKTGSYVKSAVILDMDRRTVKSYATSI